MIVSEKAWAAVQDQLPGQPHVVSLGSHLLELAGAPAAPPLLLMEVMPQGEALGGRVMWEGGACRGGGCGCHPAAA